VRIPSAIASQTCVAVRLSLKESGTIRIFRILGFKSDLIN